MIIFLIIVGIILYLVIGGIFMAIVDDDEIIGICILWPIALLILIVVGIGWAAKEIGYLIVNFVKRKINEYLKGEG